MSHLCVRANFICESMKDEPEFLVLIHKKGKKTEDAMLVLYCPFCGQKSYRSENSPGPSGGICIP